MRAFGIQTALLLAFASVVPTVSVAGVTADLHYDLENDVLTDWTEVVGGAGAHRDGIYFISLSQEIYLYRLPAELVSDNAFAFEAVVSVTPQPTGAGDETSDARMEAMFGDYSSGSLFHVEVRFITGPAGVLRIALYDIANPGGEVEMASLERDFSVAPKRTRVRLRRQEIDGTDYLFLEAEPEDTWPTDRDDPTDDPPRRAGVTLDQLGLDDLPIPGYAAFGHTGSLEPSQSWWESVRLTFCDDRTTLLPYLPWIDDLNVTVDVKPGSDENTLNNDGHGVIPTAILSTDTFDATTADPGTVLLQGMPVRAVGKGQRFLSHFEDVNGDGLDDLVVQIEDIDGTFEEGDTVATVIGLTYDGTAFTGSDTVRIVP